MKKLVLLIPMFVLSACSAISSMYLPTPNTQSDLDVAERRARIRALENEDYQIERKRRQDAIEDLGTMEMNRGKAINKAYENRSKQKIYIY